MPFFVVLIFIIDMPRIASPYALNPVLQHRFMIHTSKLPGVQLYGRSSQLPGFDNTPVTVDHMNGYVKVKGKTKWNDITIQCYHFEGITTIGLWAYFNGQHQLVQLANDRHPDVYKHDMQIWMLNPAQAPLGRWKLVGAFISSLSWGDMDWGSSDVAECTLTISYDYAKYEGV
jgi:hypothetical protein